MTTPAWLRPAAALAVALTLLAGCSSGGNKGGSASKEDPTTTVATSTSTTAPARLVAADEEDTWTFFVYMAADNNLEAAAMDDLNEMAQTSNSRFIVLLDRSPGYADDEIGTLGDFETGALLDISGGSFDAVEIAEPNTGDPDVLAQFIETGYEMAPDGHHALVIWDHGGSWLGAAWDDSSDGDNLTVPELSEAIERGLDKAGQEAFDLIGFDACLMGTYEVATALAPFSAYLLASEEVEPGAGWDWTTVDTPVRGSNTQGLSTKVIDAFVKSNDEDGSTDSTLSLIDLTRLQVLDDATEQVAAAVTGRGADQIGRVGASRLASTAFGRSPVPEEDYWLVDLGDLATLLGAVEGMEEPAAALRDAIGQVVVHSSSGPAAVKASGLAAYFPTSDTYVDARYAALDLVPSWSKLLGAFYDTANQVRDADLPLYTVADRYIEEDRVTQTDDQLQLEADVTRGTGGNVTGATLNWGRVDMADTNDVTWYGERNATVEGDTISGAYDWTYLLIGSGADQAIAYAEEHYDDDGDLDLVRVPIRFTRAGSDIPGHIVINPVHGKTYWRFYLRVGDALSEVVPRAGDTFMPLLASQDLTTMEIRWIDSTAYPMDAAPAGGITFEYQRIPSAEPIMVGLSFSDIRGNVDSMYYGTSS